MEFKFRSVDDRPPPPFPPPSPVFNHRSDLSFPLPSLPIPVNSFSSMPCSDNVHDLDRERIRDEAILREIARRREIEHEVQREIMFLEQEMAARRAAFAFDDRFRAMGHSSSPPPWSSSCPVPMPMPMPMAIRSFVGPAALDPVPLALPPVDVAAKPDKDKLIVLARPNSNFTGTKRKAAEPPSTINGPHLLGSKKKLEDEWICAICQISVRREKVLNIHLRGKKHKAMEKRFKSQNVEKNPINVSAPKKSSPDVSDSKLNPIVEEGLARSDPMQQAGRASDSELKKKFTFWCEMCQVGSVSIKVMEDHKRGKKHMAKLQKHDERVGAAIPTQTSPVTIPKQEIPDVIYEPTSLLLKAVIVPKPESLDLVYDDSKSDKYASSIVPKLDDPGVEYQAI